MNVEAVTKTMASECGDRHKDNDQMNVETDTKIKASECGNKHKDNGQ